ncbi:MAG: alpha/beta fold hydrolase [Actinomycetota bacterium]
MIPRNRILAIGGAALGVGAGIAAERLAIRRRRQRDPEAGEVFGSRRGQRSRRITLEDGATLFVEEVGPQVPKAAVFVHGSALRTDLWHYQMAGVGEHRLVFYDLRGHGLSQPKGEAPYSIPTLASDLGALISEMGLEEVVLVGHSVGGMIGMWLCLERPDLLGSSIKGLFLANTTHGPLVDTFIGGAVAVRLERLLRRPLDVVGTQARRIDALRRVVRPSDAVFWGVAFAAFGPRPSASQIDFTYDMLAETPTDVIFDLVRSYRDFDVTERLSELNVPCRVVGGTHDRLTLPEASERLAEGLPKAELQMLEGCGHMSMLERHAEFNEMLAEFLDDVLGAKESR